jgi:holo-[acyl-carrier protein] synthase
LRCFTEGELAYLKNKGPKTASGLFAAKEAVVKALGSGFDGFWPRDVEIYHDEKGRPGVTLHGAAREKADALGVSNIFVSITHNKTTAAAVAVLEK